MRGRFLLLVGSLALAAGCCSPLCSDASKAVAVDNARRWQQAQRYAAEAGWPDLDGLAGDAPDKKPSWRARLQAWRANAIVLKAAAEGKKITYDEAYAQAGKIAEGP